MATIEAILEATGWFAPTPREVARRESAQILALARGEVVLVRGLAKCSWPKDRWEQMKRAAAAGAFAVSEIDGQRTVVFQEVESGS